MNVSVWDAVKDNIIDNEEVKEMISQGDGRIMHMGVEFIENNHTAWAREHYSGPGLDSKDERGYITEYYDGL